MGKEEDITQEIINEIKNSNPDLDNSSNNQNKDSLKDKDIKKEELDLEDKNEKIDLSDVLEGKDEKPSIPKTIITSSTVNEIDQEYLLKEENAENLVEAALFVAGRYLSMQELINLTDLNQIIIKDVIKKLQKRYQKSGILRIVERNNLFKMDIDSDYHFLINRLASGEAEFTKAEQGTLGVIALKQPVKQSVVIKIRGNKSYDHIKKFRDLGLVIAKPVGHTLELSLSDEFYEYFNIHQKNNQNQ